MRGFARVQSTLLRPASLLQAALLCFSWASAASAVSFDWVTVGDPGNACDVQSQGCFGAVAYTYQVSTTEVTNAQYAEFLNAVADEDPNFLYHIGMEPGVGTSGGITRSGSSGDYSYVAAADRSEKPVNYVTFYNSLRFANWLHNGQPTGAQGSTTTEDGAYTISAAGIFANSITRNPGATIFLTSEDEWYKAAYYSALSTSYFDYPVGTDVQPVCAAPGATANTANCSFVVGDLTNVGAYTGSASPAGTFDQGGNALEWTEAVPADFGGTGRSLRGGSFNESDAVDISASVRHIFDPTSGGYFTGFRVASIPEPSTGLLLMTGLLGLAYRQRRHGLAVHGVRPSPPGAHA
jgi:formylglycine-generating enzyme